MTNIIQKATESKLATVAKKPATLKDYIKSMEGEISRALPSTITCERFTRIALSAVSSNPKLAETTPHSFLAALMGAAQLGLEPNTNLGQCYLLPFRNKGVMECQLQIGYRGLIELAYRSGKVSTIQAHTVYSNDKFSFCYGLEPKLEHVPASGQRGEPIYFYAMYRMADGVGYGFHVLSVEDAREHMRKYSKAAGGGFSPWNTDFSAMAKKTAIKKLLKYAPLSPDVARAVSADETIKHEISDDMTIIPAEYAVDAETVDAETGEIVKSETN